MNAHRTTVARGARAFIVSLVMVLAATALGTIPIASAADPSEAPVAVSSAPAGTEATFCQAVTDLGLIVGFLRETSVSEDGLVPVTVGVIAGISQARVVLDLADATYRPLVEELLASLQGLRTTVDELGEQATVGAGVATIGEAITQIGLAMDALSVEVLAPCPVPEASPTA